MRILQNSWHFIKLHRIFTWWLWR